MKRNLFLVAGLWMSLAGWAQTDTTKQSGHEVLAAIKADRLLKRIPVVVLTTSQAEEDIFMAYDRYASAYITKPHSFERFVQVVRSIEDFWFSTVSLPSR